MAVSPPPPALDEVVPARICARMVEAATQSCPTPLATPSGAATSAADSLAALSTAFTYGSILLGILVLVAGWAWGKFIAMDAEREATKAARERADEHIQAWLAKEAPGIIRSRVDFILDSTLGSGNDADAADDLGKNAG